MELPIYVSQSEELKNIRCIKAARNIKKGEVIETCPIILIPAKEEKALGELTLGNYNYAWNKQNDCFVLGYCVLLNHSFQSNAIYKRNYKTKSMVYVAIKDIKKDEEITINYNGDPECMDPILEDYLNYKY